MNDYLDYLQLERTTDLMHGGPGSGRYPLGSGERPFQSREGKKKKPSLLKLASDANKKRKLKVAEKKAAEKRAEKLKEADEYKKQREEQAKEKERILKGGTAAEVLKIADQLTYEEMSAAQKRLNLQKQLREIADSEAQIGFNKIDQAVKNFGTVINWGYTGTRAYNLFANVYNATEEGQKKPMALIGNAGEGKKKK